MDNSEHAQELSELRNARAVLNEHCEALQSEAEELEQVKGLLESRVSEMEADNLDLISRLEDLEEALEKATAELERRERVQKMFRKPENETDSKSG
ncbi:hypothetical protein KAR91_50235 [Candidatus Pacearchaeota archaeon]|nr:hypothetical protein [Candidatus Pacearchaeota archaeon]